MNGRKGVFMSNKKFERKMKENNPVLAICYDFDKTLSPNDMQAQGYIQAVKFDIEEFWKQSNELAEKNGMDQNSAWMYKMLEEARGRELFTRTKLQEYGAKVELFPGVEDWFDRIRSYALQHGVIVEHYIISSGLKEMIEGTSIYKNNAFEKVFASCFYFDERGVAVWPAQIVNYTNKTQFLFRIEKGVLDTNDQGVNDYFPPEDIRVPFRNMIYIGDSDTDIPCMKLVNSYGGHSIGVYNPDTKDKGKVYRMFEDQRVKYFASADYRENSELDSLVKAIVDRTAVNEKLENIYFKKKQEVAEFYKTNSKDTEKNKKDRLIEKLEESKSFQYTHQVISELKQHSKWTEEQRKKLYKAANTNSQISWILGDADVKDFFENLMSCDCEDEKEIEEIRDKIKRLCKKDE